MTCVATKCTTTRATYATHTTVQSHATSDTTAHTSHMKASNIQRDDEGVRTHSCMCHHMSRRRHLRPDCSDRVSRQLIIPGRRVSCHFSHAYGPKWIPPSEVQPGTTQHPTTHHECDVLRVWRSPKMPMTMTAVGQQRFGPSVLFFVAAPVAPRRRGQADPSPQLWGGLRHQPRVELWWPSRLCSARKAASLPQC